MQRITLFCLLLLLSLIVVAYRSKPAPRLTSPLTAQQVAATFQAAGIAISDVQAGAQDPNSLLPKGYKEQFQFKDTVRGNHGEIFVCEQRNACDAVYMYLNALQLFTGSSLYQSKNGLVVVQLDRGFTSDQARRYADVVAAL